MARLRRFLSIRVANSSRKRKAMAFAPFAKAQRRDPCICLSPAEPTNTRYSLFFLFRAFTLNQIGDPINLNVSRISFARNLS